MSDWRKAVLGALGYKPTPANMKFLTSWQAMEGGDTHNSAKFNWLNTTHGVGPAINSVGVKRFSSFGEGVRYTTETLMNGKYADILQGLAKGDPYAVDVSAGLQTWVSGRPDGNPTYASRVLGHQVSAPSPQRAQASVAGFKAKAAAVPRQSPQDKAWSQAISMIFEDDPEMQAIMRSIDDRGARAAGLVDPRGSLRQVDLAHPEYAGKGAAVTKVASQQLGKPYVFGSGPDTSSFDCSDLIQWAYGQLGVKIPRTTFDQIKAGRSVKGQKLQPGDLVFPSTHHVVMYVGGGKVIAAPHTGTVVQYQPLSRFGPLVDVRRVL